MDYKVLFCILLLENLMDQVSGTTGQGPFHNQLTGSMRFTIVIYLQCYFLEHVFAFVAVVEI